MKLILPDYDFKFEDGIAEVKDGILYIYKPGAFKKVMYRLTYVIYGKNECYFCHRKLRTNMLESDKSKYFSKITLDHLIPQDFGGPTITNNLRPVCRDCNNEKGNMYFDEYEDFKKIKTEDNHDCETEKIKFMEQLRIRQEKRRYGEIESIPKEYFPKESVNNIYVNFWVDQPLGAVYKKQDDFLKKYKRLPKLIIISQNKFLLDGFNTILLGKYNYSKKLDVVVLENVYFKGFPE